MGPCGGAGGGERGMNMTGVTRIAKVVVRHGAAIDAVSFLYERDGNLEWTPQWGGGGGGFNEINLAPNEYFICINGYYGVYRKNVVVRSLTFVSNLHTYGPYGEQEGIAFTLPAANGKIIGFHARSGVLLDAIGTYIKNGMFLSVVTFTLENGKSIDFWSDRWCGETSLQTDFPDLFSEVIRKDLTVAECRSSRGWKWRRILRGVSFNQAACRNRIWEMKNRLFSLQTTDRPDGIGWRWNAHNIFTVKSAYGMISDGGIKDHLVSQIWDLHIPTKVQIFIWLVLKKRHLTIDRLVARGWRGDPSCVLCGGDTESIDHLFSTCVFFRFLLLMVSGEDGTLTGQIDVRSTWEKILGNDFMKIRTKSLITVTACWWVTWVERNNVIFRNAETDPLMAVDHVQRLVRSWKESRLANR